MGIYTLMPLQSTSFNFQYYGTIPVLYYQTLRWVSILTKDTIKWALALALVLKFESKAVEGFHDFWTLLAPIWLKATQMFLV